MGRTSNRRWKCPYFSGSDKVRITCKGEVRVTMRFAEYQEFKLCADLYCGDKTRWQECRIYEMLSRMEER